MHCHKRARDGKDCFAKASLWTDLVGDAQTTGSVARHRADGPACEALAVVCPLEAMSGREQVKPARIYTDFTQCVQRVLHGNFQDRSAHGMNILMSAQQLERCLKMRQNHAVINRVSPKFMNDPDETRCIPEKRQRESLSWNGIACALQLDIRWGVDGDVFNVLCSQCTHLPLEGSLVREQTEP